MTIRLTKAQVLIRDCAVEDLRSLGEAVEAAATAYNEAVTSLWEPVNEAVTAYNERLEAIKGEDGLGGIVESWRTEWDEKSERWQEGQRGQDADVFIVGYEQILLGLDDIDVDPPEPIDLPDFSEAPGRLEEAPDAPDRE